MGYHEIFTVVPSYPADSGDISSSAIIKIPYVAKCEMFQKLLDRPL